MDSDSLFSEPQSIDGQSDGGSIFDKPSVDPVAVGAVGQIVESDATTTAPPDPTPAPVAHTSYENDGFDDFQDDYGDDFEAEAGQATQNAPIEPTSAPEPEIVSEYKRPSLEVDIDASLGIDMSCVATSPVHKYDEQTQASTLLADNQRLRETRSKLLDVNQHLRDELKQIMKAVDATVKQKQREKRSGSSASPKSSTKPLSPYGTAAFDFSGREPHELEHLLKVKEKEIRNLMKRISLHQQELAQNRQKLKQRHVERVPELENDIADRDRTIKALQLEVKTLKDQLRQQSRAFECDSQMFSSEAVRRLQTELAIAKDKAREHAHNEQALEQRLKLNHEKLVDITLKYRKLVGAKKAKK
jgi:hypothetical protein